MKKQNNQLEVNGTYLEQAKPTAGRYIAIGMLIAIALFFSLELVTLFSGNQQLFSFFLVNGKYYASGAIPNSSAGGGWNLGPLFFLSLLIGIISGWGYYKLKIMLKYYLRKKKAARRHF